MLHNLNAKKAFFSVLILIIMVLAFNIYRQAPTLLSAEFKNPDSYTRLVLVRDWPTTTDYQYMPRDGAPDGSYLHWSMAHTWVMQHLAWGLQWLGVPSTQALLWAGGGLTLGSLLLLTIFCAMAIIQLGGRLAALATALALVTSQGLMSYAQLLQITHHIFMLMPVAVAVWLIFSQKTNPMQANLRHFIAGLCLGAALWISPETMPLVAAMATIMAARRLQFSDSGHCWPLAAGIGAITVTTWLIDPPPPGFSAWALDHISLAWLAWASVLAILLCLTDKLVAHRQRSLSASVFILALAAILGGSLWLFATPGALAGPAGLLPPELKTLWWDHIKELQPATKFYQYLSWGGLPAIAGVLLMIQAWRQRCLWQAVLACTALVYAAMALWHLRMGAAASLAGALAWGIWLCGQPVFTSAEPNQLPAKAQYRAAAILFAPVLILLLTLISIVIENKTDTDSHSNKSGCKLANIADVLNKIPPATILITLNSAPQLQWLTHHRVIAGNYHHNTQGLLDFYHLWRSTGDDQDAQAIAKKRNITYLLACKNETVAKGDFLGSRAERGDHITWMESPIRIENWLLYKVTH